MAGLLIFGVPVITLAGFGTRSFMLLLSGTIGNLINANLYKNAHLSIGASTHIFSNSSLMLFI